MGVSVSGQRICRLAEQASAADTPDEALRTLRTLREELVEFERQHVARALTLGEPVTAVATALGVSRQSAHRRFRDLVPPRGRAERMLATPEAQLAVEYARREASRQGAASVGSVHLLMGILCSGDSETVQALNALGITIDATREAAESARHERRSGRGVPSGAGARGPDGAPRTGGEGRAPTHTVRCAPRSGRGRDGGDPCARRHAGAGARGSSRLRVSRVIDSSGTDGCRGRRVHGELLQVGERSLAGAATRASARTRAVRRSPTASDRARSASSGSSARRASAARARAPAWPTPRRSRIPAPRSATAARSRSSSSGSCGASSRSGHRALAVWSASSTSSTLLSSASAISDGVGDRPSFVVSCSDARWTWSERSCTSRGTLHAPAVVAEVALELAHDRRHRVAWRTRSRDRGRSGRSPLISANDATWTRSSYSSRSP